MPRAVILTALPVEYQAVRTYLIKLREKEHPQGTIYEEGKFVANGQEWEVGIAEIGAGNTVAAAATERVIAYFKPNILLFVGIARGIKDVKIGDVVAATDVYGYESGKVGDGFFTRPKVGKSADRLVHRARAEARKQEWLQRLSSNPVSEPCVFVAPIAAGQKVIASKKSDIFEFLRASYNDAIALEMEGFGFLSAAFAYPDIPAIVIRGISDLIEGKNDDAIEPEEVRQKKASLHASAFAFQILSKLQTTQSVKPALDHLPMQKPKEQVLGLLNRLLPSQLDTVIFRYDVELAHLSNGTPNQRSIELIRYALQKEGTDLSQLLTVIYTVVPHMK
ncbi:MAG: 5'-methylthioadenosine/S-adenosylhomocysteine nucleosidase [Symploca sp. SIO2C1]|nr:5'-methylthioadenosine/S-adenosylhomocysteine nucleosidase [Symploca sp. SIO2C1]